MSDIAAAGEVFATSVTIEGGSSAASPATGAPHAEVRVSQRSGMAAQAPVAVKAVTKAPWTRSPSRDQEETGKASPAEFDLATGGRKLGGGVPPVSYREDDDGIAPMDPWLVGLLG